MKSTIKTNADATAAIELYESYNDAHVSTIRRTTIGGRRAYEYTWWSGPEGHGKPGDHVSVIEHAILAEWLRYYLGE